MLPSEQLKALMQAVSSSNGQIQVNLELNLQKPRTMDTLLHIAARNGDAPLIQQIDEFEYKASPLETELLNDRGRTPLAIALGGQHVRAVFALLDAGAQVEPQMAIDAVQNNESEIAVALLRRVCEEPGAREEMAGLLETMIDQLGSKAAQEDEDVFEKIEKSATLLIQGGVPITDIKSSEQSLLERAVEIGSGVLLRAVGASSAVDTWPHALVALRNLVEVHELALICGTRESLALALDEAQHERSAACTQLQGKRREIAVQMLDEQIASLKAQFESLPTPGQRRRLYGKTAALLAVAYTAEQAMPGLVDACGTPRTKEAFDLSTAAPDKWVRRLEEQRQDTGAIELAMRLLSLSARSNADEKEALAVVELVLVHCNKQVVNSVLFNACDELFSSEHSGNKVLLAAAVTMLHSGADPTATDPDEPSSVSPLAKALAAADEQMVELLVMESRGSSQRNAVAELVQEVAKRDHASTPQGKMTINMLGRVLLNPEMANCLEEGFPAGMGTADALRVALENSSLPLLQALLSVTPDGHPRAESLFDALEGMMHCVVGSTQWCFLQSAIDELIEAGAPVTGRNQSGYLALDLAQVLGDSSVIWLLKLATKRSVEEEGPSYAMYALLSELCTAKLPLTKPNPVVKSWAELEYHADADSTQEEASEVLMNNFANMEVGWLLFDVSKITQLLWCRCYH